MLLNYDEFLKYIPKKPTYVLFGNKLTHSVSRDIHHKVFEHFNIDAEYIYVELKENELDGAISHLKRYFKGANVTIPYKTDMIPLMEECDDAVLKLNSLNTIKIQNNKAYGYNTDILGVIDCLKLDNITLTSKKVALLGYGGTANVVAEILANELCDITIYGRDLNKANEFKSQVLKNHPNALVHTKELKNFKDNYDMIFNTTPVGMNNLEGKSPIPTFRKPSYVFDAVYNPYYTKFLKLGMRKRIKVRNGLYMLMSQALYAEKIWNNIDLSESNLTTNIYQMLETSLYKKRLKNKNIVLVGFMGCGKSTVARKLARIMDMNILDTDALIEEEQGMKIAEIFEKFGESHFRKLETELSYKLKDVENSVISVGGGFILNEENAKNMKQNSIVVFLDIPFKIISSRILGDKSRPLANSNDIKALFDKRYPTYKNVCDIHIRKNDTPKNISQKILKSI